jgi:LL-diaminopimelate aminotransferase
MPSSSQDTLLIQFYHLYLPRFLFSKSSDGAKCDIMRLQQMFGPNSITAVQDPSYPVYVDTSVMLGQTGDINKETMQYSNIVYMPCTPENGFFPDYANHPRADVVYLCSPKYVKR